MALQGVRNGAIKTRRKPSAYLRDMRWVYNNAEMPEESEGKKKCRAFYLESPEAFLSQLGQLERALRAAKVPEQAKSAEVVGADSVADEGEERCIELAERLLKECRDGVE